MDLGDVVLGGIFQQLKANRNFAQLQELSIVNSKLNNHNCTLLAEWISAMNRASSALRVLGIGPIVDPGVVCESLTHVSSLVTLRITDSNLTSSDQSLGRVIAASRAISTFDFSRSRLFDRAFGLVTKVIARGHALGNSVSLNMTGALKKGSFGLLISGLESLRPFLSELILDDNAITVDELARLLNFVTTAPVLKKLSLNGIFSSKQKGVGGLFVDLLAQTAIETLAISGRNTPGLELELLPILAVATGHKALRRLDISHNRIGDIALAAATELVGASQVLQSIKIKGMVGVTPPTLREFLSACARSPSLLKMPCNEAEALAIAPKEDAVEIKSLATMVRARIAANRRAQSDPIVTPLMFRNDPVLLPLIHAAQQAADERYAARGRSDAFSADALDARSREWSHARSVGLDPPIARVVHIPRDAPAPVAATEPEPTDSGDSANASLPSVAESGLSPLASAAPSAAPPAPAEEPSRVVSDWIKDFSKMTTLRWLGRGTIGRVGLRQDGPDGRLIAVKSILRPEESIRDFTEMFMREVEALVTLRHPCILALVGYSLPTEERLAEIATEYAENGDLGHLLELRADGNAPEWADATGIAIILCGIVHGMRYLHEQGIMHRDLKPTNVLIDGEAHAKIGDFGSVRPDSIESTITQGITSTEYTAPEIWLEEDYTPAVDVYSFALMMYEILVGQPVFPPKLGLTPLSQKAIRGERPPIPETISAPVEDVIQHCWSPDPAERYTFAQIADLFSFIDFEIAPDVDADRIAEYVQSLP
jgi:hypothetical protein